MRTPGQCITCGGESCRPEILQCHRCRWGYSDSADVDEMAVERLMVGDRVTATRGEIHHVVAELTRRGWSARRIAEQLGYCDRTVVRIRRRVAA